MILFLDYDLSETTYWSPNDLWEVKINICHILVYGHNFKVSFFASWESKYRFFCVKDFKNSISFGLWSLGGHILAYKWPLRGQNEKSQFLLHGFQNRFFWIRDLKNSINFGFLTPRGQWPLIGQNSKFLFLLQVCQIQIF